MTPHPVPDPKRVADLLALLEVTRQLGATVELDPLLSSIADAATKVLGCERATVFVYDRRTNELFSRFAHGFAGAELREIRFPADQGIAGGVVHSGRVDNVPDAYADQRFNRAIDLQTGFRTRNMLTCPLRGHDNAIVGVLQLLNKHHGGFDARDEELVYYLGAQAGVALQRQMLLEEFAEKQRIQRDLNLARDIQKGLLPEGNPQTPGFDVAGWNKPADETGGDCYDFMPLADGHLAITIADATGHGIGPALVIAECRALFRATINLTQDLGTAVTQVNRLLCEDLPDDRFVTAFFGLLWPQERRVVYSSAGHGPILVFRAGNGEISEAPVGGIPLGIMAETEYDAPVDIPLESGDMMILFTDGFFEWSRPDGEQFGTPRLHDLIRTHRALPAAEIISLVHESVLKFSEGTPQADDLTAVIIKAL